jgi:hypothetical protein
MIYISHRGNINGRIPEKENHPDYVMQALASYQCEIDVWLLKGKWYLGHDSAQYEVPIKFLLQDCLWLHAKNVSALWELCRHMTNCFWHQNDDVTLTSERFLWTYPNKPLMPSSIAVLPELYGQSIDNCAGVCSDFIERYAKVDSR